MRRGRRTWSLQGGKARPFSRGKTRNRENVELKEKEGSNLTEQKRERERWRRKRSNYRWEGQENKLEREERRNVHRTEGWRLWWGWMERRDKSERNTCMITLHPLLEQRQRKEKGEQAKEEGEKARENRVHFWKEGADCWRAVSHCSDWSLILSVMINIAVRQREALMSLKL